MDFKRHCVILLAGLCGCVSVNRLEKHLTANARSLSYIHDVEKAPDSEKTSRKVIVEVSASPSLLTPIGQVHVTNRSLIPLIIFYQWNKDFTYRLGDKEVSEDLAAFVRSSAIQEFNRSTPFTADSIVSETSPLKLSITIDELEATSPYKVNGFIMYALVAYIFYEKQEAGPGAAYSRFTCTLSRGSERIFTKTFESRKAFEPIITRNTSYKKFRGALTTNLTELLSLTFKENIEAAISETERQVGEE